MSIDGQSAHNRYRMAQPKEELEREKERRKEAYLLRISQQICGYKKAFLKLFLALFSVLLFFLHSLCLTLYN